MLGLALGPARAATDYGSMSAPSTTIKAGCQPYSVSYVIHPPAGMDWTFFIQVTDPQGTHVGGILLTSGADALSGTRSFTQCTPQVVPGTYTLTGELDVSDGAQAAPTTYWLPPAHFTLTGTATQTTQVSTHHKRHHRKHHRHHRRHHTPVAAASIPTL